jgi:glycine oxidase
MNDFLVIGGGALGLFTARELVHSGATVGIIDSGMIGQEASWAGGGILSPLRPWNEPAAILCLWQWSQTQYPAFASRLHDDTGIDPEWIRCGILYLLTAQEESAAISWCESHGIRNEKLAPGNDAYPEAVPCPPGYSALLLPDIAHIRNPRLLRALKRSLELSHRVSIRENCAARGFHVENDLVTHVILENGQRIAANQFIVTAGAWSPRLLDALPPPLPRIEPVKGQMIVFDARPDLLRHIVFRDGHYLIPRKDGKILAGSTTENAGFDKRPSPEALHELQSFAFDTLPGLRRFPITHHWAGIRPGSPGGIPYIGSHPTIRNLHFNCGHFRNGLATSPASARLLTDILLQRAPVLPIEPYSLETDRRTGEMDSVA